jgi:hypothetical protein
MVVNANENDLKDQVGEHSRLPKRVVGPADATDFTFEEWTIDVPTAWLFSCPPSPSSTSSHPQVTSHNSCGVYPTFTTSIMTQPISHLAN